MRCVSHELNIKTETKCFIINVLCGLVKIIFILAAGKILCIESRKIFRNHYQRASTVHSTQARAAKITVAMGMTLLGLASCAQYTPTAEAPASAPLPVGHVYPTTVVVPPPQSHRMRITVAQREDYQQAFNVIALKSALMVGALSCGQQRQYDVFMTNFQPHILAEQHVMDGYFRRTASRTAEDNFVTLLANNQSVSAQAQGTGYCRNNSAEFNAVLALRTPQALDSFVTDQPPAPVAELAASAP